MIQYRTCDMNQQKRFLSISSKLTKLGSHTLVTKVENLVARQKMLLANSNHVGKKKVCSFKNKANSVWFCDMNFFSPKQKTWLLLGLYWSQFLALPINMLVYAKIWNQRGNYTWKHHMEGLYKEIIQAKEIYSVSNSLKD